MTEFLGKLFDGQSTMPIEVVLQLGPESLKLRKLEGGESFDFFYHEIDGPEKTGLGFRYRLRKIDPNAPSPWMISITDPADNQNLREKIFETHGPIKRLSHGLSGLPVWKLLFLTLLAIGIFFALVYTGLQFAYRLTPISYDLHLGRQVDSTLSKFYEPCHSPALDTFFQKALTRLALPSDNFKHRVIILNDPTVNAMALPGGTIYVYRGLLEKSTNPDELLGVISHEISHSELRHTVRQIIQSTGISYLITLTLGMAIDGMDMLEGLESTLEMSSILLTLRYSRGFESEADSLGIIRMHQARLKVGPLDTLLNRISPKPRPRDRILSWFSTHPLSKERSLRFSAAKAQETFSDDSIFSDERLNWNTLKSSCPTVQDSIPLWKKFLK